MTNGTRIVKVSVLVHLFYLQPLTINRPDRIRRLVQELLDKLLSCGVKLGLFRLSEEHSEG
jgi:hypothetical protein